MSVVCKMEKAHGLEMWRVYVNNVMLCQYQCREIAQTKADQYRRKLAELQNANASKNDFYKSTESKSWR